MMLEKLYSDEIGIERMASDANPSPPACPFILRNRSVQYEANGCLCILPAGGTSTLNVRVEEFFSGLREKEYSSGRSSTEPAVLVGALPFDPDGKDFLYQPRALRISHAPVSIDTRDMVQEEPCPMGTLNIQPVPSGSQYVAAVERMLRRLSGDGDELLEKVVLARSLRIESTDSLDPLALVAKLSVDPQVTTFLTPLPCESSDRESSDCESKAPPAWLAGATPELLVSRRGQQVVSHPLAGSAPRCADAGADRMAAERLLASDKDRYEHRFVVEAIVEALSPYCSQMDIPEGPTLYSTATMWHLGTRISGVLRDSSTSVAELVAALHPTPAVCGTPPRAALQVINQAEQFDRGFYSGAVGWVDCHGDGDWYVAIRCAHVQGRIIQLFAGAGIVPDSVPDIELQETSAKFKTWLSALGITDCPVK